MFFERPMNKYKIKKNFNPYFLTWDIFYKRCITYN